MTIVRTVLGDVQPDDLGIVLGHEHLVGRPPPDAATEDDLILDDVAAAERELCAARDAGVGCVVEMTTIDYGRDAHALRRLSDLSGVHLVATTGMNKGVFSGRFTTRLDVDELADWMVQEVTDAMNDADPLASWPTRDERDGASASPVRAGLIKASSSLDGPTEGERRLLDAAAIAHLRCGAPVSTHTEKGTWAVEQAAWLIERGVPPASLLIGHVDLAPDPGPDLDLGAMGVYIGFDQFGKHKYGSDQARIDRITCLASHGHLQQLILSGDTARKSSRSIAGGPGLTHLTKAVTEQLTTSGFGAVELRTLTQDNPQCFLAFTPVHGEHRP